MKRGDLVSVVGRVRSVSKSGDWVQIQFPKPEYIKPNPWNANHTKQIQVNSASVFLVEEA